MASKQPDNDRRARIYTIRCTKRKLKNMRQWLKKQGII